MDGGGEEAGASRPDDPGDDGSLRGRLVLDQQGLEAEAGIPIPTVGVEDPEGRPPARRSGPAARHDDVGGLPNDVPPEPDPRLPGELEADSGPLPDRGGHRAGEPRRLEDEEGDARPAGEGSEPAETIGEPGCSLRPGRQVDDEEVHRPAGQERAGHRQPLIGVLRRQHHEPRGLDAAGHGLHRIEGLGEVQPGNDRAARLGLRREPEGDRGPAAREVAAEREAHPPGQPARPEDGIERRKTSGVDPRRVGHVGLRGQLRQVCHCQRAHYLARGARRGRSPARSKGREGCRHVRGKGRHQVVSIEHLFE